LITKKFKPLPIILGRSDTIVEEEGKCHLVEVDNKTSWEVGEQVVKSDTFYIGCGLNCYER